MESWMTLALWIVVPLAFASTVIVWSALALGSACDDLQDELRAREREREALGRAVHAVQDTQ